MRLVWAASAVSEAAASVGAGVESLAGFYLPEGFKDVAAYVVVLLMLMVKPNGLLVRVS